MGNSNSNKIQEIIRDLVWFCVFAILISIVIIAIPAFGLMVEDMQYLAIS